MEDRTKASDHLSSIFYLSSSIFHLLNRFALIGFGHVCVPMRFRFSHMQKKLLPASPRNRANYLASARPLPLPKSLSLSSITPSRLLRLQQLEHSRCHRLDAGFDRRCRRRFFAK